MSREGNTRCFAMFPDDDNFLNLLRPTHPQASVSREDSHLNYHDGCVVCATSITVEICTVSMFNEKEKEFQDIVTNEVRVLLKNHEENEDNSFFACQ